jgi:hypothetical protein
MIQSIGLLKIMSSSEVWGICYQDNNKRVRGDDILYRLTLAVMAFEQDGCSTRAACNVVVAEPAVKRKMGYKGLANESDSLRVSIIRYRNRRKMDGIVLEADLCSMQEYWRWLHIAEMRGTEWHDSYLAELRKRAVAVEVAIERGGDCGERGLLRGLWVKHIVNLAMELHDSKDYDAARNWYGLAVDSIRKDRREENGEMLKWLAEQCERCGRGQGRTHAPVLVGLAVVPVTELGEPV